MANFAARNSFNRPAMLSVNIGLGGLGMSSSAVLGSIGAMYLGKYIVSVGEDLKKDRNLLGNITQIAGHLIRFIGATITALGSIINILSIGFLLDAASIAGSPAILGIALGVLAVGGAYWSIRQAYN